jgi:type I restriction enzyme S subunit
MTFDVAPTRARRRVKGGDTIVSTVRTYLKAIAFMDCSPDNLIVSTGFAVLRPKSTILPKFLWRLTQSNQFVDAIVCNSVGVGYPAITPNKLGSLSIWIPALSEQRTIAAFLDRETARIDAVITEQGRLVELLREKRAVLISQAVTRGLDPSVPMRDSGVEWIGQIPTHWQMCSYVV